jgi:hypothetical protein
VTFPTLIERNPTETGGNAMNFASSNIDRIAFCIGEGSLRVLRVMAWR